jgi:hypothetical protein
VAEEKEYKISIDPRILELLGPSLYTNIYYILAELIANAYDADSENVYIIANSNAIIVEDDGNGMSYSDGDIDHFLSVAKVSRNSSDESSTKGKSRLKMGRKGVGKLAALSVSNEVKIKTIKNNEKSGFILSRHVNEDKKLKAISEEDIKFEKISNKGTSIEMTNPQYRLHNDLNVVKRNLLKIFPLVDSDFKIHIVRGKHEEIIEKFDENIISDLSTLIVLGEEFSRLSTQFCEVESNIDFYKAQKKQMMFLEMENIQGETLEYTMEVMGWIGTYKSTRGRKANITDFPDNFISLYSHNKLGEFNILPIVGQNKLSEVYVVGQLYIDLFEDSDLPDMALSNRQGYKSDDKRYGEIINYVRDILLPDVLKLRDKYADRLKANKRKIDWSKQEQAEQDFRTKVMTYNSNTTRKISTSVSKLFKKTTMADREAVEKIVTDAINANSGLLGMKPKLDSMKKRILISHTSKDKDLADIVYNMLLYNNVPSSEIIYTNSDDEEARIPENKNVYDYLKGFFIDSYSDQKIYVIYITSENMGKSWGAVSEVGAGWITQVSHKIFNIDSFRPEHPLNDEQQWQQSYRVSGSISMHKKDADIFCVKLEDLCDTLGYKKKTRAENINKLRSFINNIN